MAKKKESQTNKKAEEAQREARIKLLIQALDIKRDNNMTRVFMAMQSMSG